MASKYGDLNCDCNRFRRKLLMTAMTVSMAQGALALPQNGEVVAGNAVLSVEGKNLTVHQSSDRAVIDYQSFNVAADERVQFIQPDANSATLNRVIGNDLSDIAGRIDANGQVFLINPNGVLFGEGAQVDVGGLVVSTLDATNDAFMSGESMLQGDGGVIENRGTIDAEGNVVFIGAELQNSGTITADGQIALHSGHGVLMTVEGSSIPVLLEEGGFGGRVVNSGHLQAPSVSLSASGQGMVGGLDVTLQNTGVVRAVTATGEGGVVTLAADADVGNSGMIDVSADSALTDGAGGSFEVRSRNVNQTGVILAEGAGSGHGGAVDVTAAQNIALHSGSNIRADGGIGGDGGEVNIIAKNATRFTGDAMISARGGQLAGDGGFVEVSGFNYVDVNGTVDVSAAAGSAGLWFIDPTDIVISNSADTNGSFIGGDPRVWTLSGTPASSNISATALWSALGGGDVVIDTASGAASPGNINISALLDYNGIGSLRTLTLNADNEVQFQAGSGFWDSDTGTAADGLNLVINSGGGITMADTSQVDARGGKINFTAATGNIVLSNAFSIASGFDAVQITATTGSILDAGDTFYDIATPTVGAGAILRAAGEIGGLDTLGRNLDAESTGASIVLGSTSDLFILRLVAADTINVSSTAQLNLGGASEITADNIYLAATGTMTLPLAGVSAANYLALQGSDVVDANGNRTLNLSAGGALAFSFSGLVGDLQLNSSVAQLNLTGDPTNAITVIDADAIAVGGLTMTGGGVEIISGDGSDLTVSGAVELDNATGNLTLTAGRDLLINADIVDSVGGVSNSGDVNLRANSAVTFASNSDVNSGSGNVFVTALGGDIALGHIQGGSLNLAAIGDISDANGALANLTSNLANFAPVMGSIGSAADPIEGVLSQVAFDSISGAVYLNNSQGLQLAGIDVGGDIQLNITSAGNMIMQQINPVIGGNARFNLAAGNWILLDGGWNTSGDLTVTAQGINDADSTVYLSAANADLTFGGANTTLNVDFDTLSLDATSGQWVQVFDSDALSVAALNNTTGDINITTAAGFDLTFTDTAPNIGGTLTLDVGGDWLLPEAGVTVTSNLSVVADNILDSDTGITLGANAADLTWRDGTAGFSISSSFNTLDISAPIAGDISIVDADGLQVNSLTSAGSLSLSATNADLQLAVLPVFAGDLTLSTVGSGDVVVPAGQITVAGDLTIIADNLDDGDTSYDLVADNAAITLRDGSGGTAWSTQFNSLVMGIAGVGAHTVNNSQDLTVGGLQSGGDLTLINIGITDMTGAAVAVSGGLSVTSSGPLSVNGGTVNVGGGTSFDAGGDVDLQNANLNLTGNVDITATGSDIALQNTVLSTNGTLAFDADNVIETGGASTLAADTLGLQLQDGSLATTLNTAINRLDFDTAGNGSITLNNSQALTVDTLNTNGDVTLISLGDLGFGGVGGSILGDVVLTANGGDVIVPDAGAILVNNLTITADDIRDSDTDISVSADNVVLNLSAANSDAVWTTSFNTLILDRQGTGNVTLNNDKTLQALGVQNGGDLAFNVAGNLDLQNITVASNGDFSITTTGVGDLLLQNSAVSALGDLTLNVNNIVDAGGSSTYAADNAIFQVRDGAAATLDTAFNTLSLTNAGSVTVNNAQALAVNALNTGGDVTITSLGDLDFSAIVGAFAGDVTLVATGGDAILSDAGLIATNDLTLTANGIRDSDQAVTLTADQAVLSLQPGGADVILNTAVNQLGLTHLGSGVVTVSNTQALLLNDLQAGGDASLTVAGDLTSAGPVNVAGDLRINTAGDWFIPATGFSTTNGLTVNAQTIQDGDFDVVLAASDAEFQLSSHTNSAVWNTAFDRLSLTAIGAAAITVNNSQDLTVEALQGGGDVDVSALGDLTLVEAVPTIAGNLSLTSTATLWVDPTGLSVANGLVINATTLSDGDVNLVLSADHADITMQNLAADALWRTNFNSLALGVAGVGNLTIDNGGALVGASLQTPADLTINTVGDLTLLETAPSVGGDLTLNTSAGGNVVVNDSGLQLTNAMVINANDLIDSDGTVSLQAADADLTLTGLGASRTYNTQLASATWDLTGAAVNVVQTGAQTLLGLTASHDFSLETDAILTVMPTDLTTTAQVSLSSGAAAIELMNSGLSTGGALSLSGLNVTDTNGNPVGLTATDLNLNLSGTALDFNADVDQLALTANNATQIALSNVGDLFITNWSAPNVQTLGLSVMGDLMVPDVGLSAANRISLEASDLYDTDRNVTLTGGALWVSLSAPASDLVLSTDIQSVDISMGASASVTLEQAGGLTLEDLNSDGFAARVADGNLSVSVTDGDLVVENNVLVADASGNGTRTGRVDLLVDNGNLTIGANNDVTIASRNTVDVAPAGNLAPGVSLQLVGTESDDRTITLGNGSNTVSISAEGADIFISARANGVPSGSAREVVQNAGSVLETYNQPNDRQTGTVTINDFEVEAAGNQQAYEGRQIALVMDYDFTNNDSGILDEIDNPEKVEDPVVPEQEANAHAYVGAQFVEVFGQCNENDEQQKKRCRIESALKAFLSHWLVGGELPPKVEI